MTSEIFSEVKVFLELKDASKEFGMDVCISCSHKPSAHGFGYDVVLFIPAKTSGELSTEVYRTPSAESAISFLRGIEYGKKNYNSKEVCHAD